MSLRSVVSCAGLAVALLGFSACGGGDEGGTKPKPAPKAGAKAPSGAKKPAKTSPRGSGGVDRTTMVALFKDWPKAPDAGNRTSKTRVALGNKLYHDKTLSAGGDISCASCHAVETYGQDNKKTSPGTGGAAGERNTPTSLNAFRQFAQFWDGRAATVEQQATMPILTSNEHGIKDEAELIAAVKKNPDYEPMFKKAFKRDRDNPITIQNIQMAIGAFERKLVTVSPFDKWLDGDDAALTAEQKKGMAEFVGVGCATCHMGRGLGGSDFKKLGDKVPFETEDIGRAKITKNDSDKYMFKVPMLLNVDKTAPYYHDGSIATLEEAVTHMAKYQLGKDLTDAQVKSIVTFLKALTGPLPKI